METVLLVETKNLNKVKDILLKDDLISRSSMTFKEGGIISKKDYYIYVSGTEDQCKRALELTKELTKEVTGKEKDELINKIKEEENRAIEGMGGIFG
jgi:hypothetical protein